jgi:hypothetical protein
LLTTSHSLSRLKLGTQEEVFVQLALQTLRTLQAHCNTAGPDVSSCFAK